MKLFITSNSNNNLVINPLSLYNIGKKKLNLSKNLPVPQNNYTVRLRVYKHKPEMLYFSCIY